MVHATTPVTSQLERMSTGVGTDHQGLDLTHLTVEGRVVRLREGGDGPNPLREACQDHAIGMAVEQAVATGEVARVERQPWA